MKHNNLLLALTCFLLIACNSAQAQTLTGQPQQPAELFIKYETEEYDKRKGALSANSDLIAHVFVNSLAAFLQKYKDKAEGEAEAKKNALFILHWSQVAICVSNVFWKDGKPQEATVKNYISRIGLVPLEVRTEWAGALAKANGAELRFPLDIGAMIVQDRLFEASSFKQEESKKLLIRINSIPQDAIKKWAGVRQLHEYQAAISLINTDSLFSKDLFQPEVFAKKIEEITKK